MRRVLAIVFAGMLVLTAFPAGPIGTASASHDCSTVDAAVTAATFTYVNHNKCLDNHDTTDYQAIREQDAIQTRNDLYATATQRKASSSVTNAIMWNSLEKTAPSAWMDVEVAMAKEHENDSTKAAAQVRANQTIERTYASMDINRIEDWNVTAASIEQMENISDSEANVSDSFVSVPTEDNDGDADSGLSTEIVGFGTKNVTLVNGTSHVARTIEIKVTYDTGTSSYSNTHTIGPNTGEKEEAYSGSEYPNNDYEHPDLIRVTVENPNDDGSVTVLRFQDYADKHAELNSQIDGLKAESGTYVSKVWDGLEAGSVNSSEIISRNTAMWEMAAGELNGSNSMSRSTVALGMMGLSIPDMNGTGTMEVQYRGATFKGMVLAEEAPGGSWTESTTYNASNMTGPVYAVTTNGEMKTLTGEFTLRNMTNREGEEISKVNHSKVVYKTANTEELLEKMDLMREQRQIAENRERAIIGDGSDGENDMVYLLSGLGLAAAAVVGLKLREDGQG